MTRLPKSFWHAWRRDFGKSILTTGFIFFWVLFSIALFIVLEKTAVLTDSSIGIFFLIVGLGGAGGFGTLIQRGLARRIVPRCQHCGASLSMYLNKGKPYSNVIMGKCPKCEKKLSQPSPGAYSSEAADGLSENAQE